ncbi:MAG TPA: SCO family protein [Rhodoplanes sp.]|nr:SCO family protein [Rhodoplanes sp.]
MRRPSRLVVLAAAFGLGLALCVGLVLLMSGRFSDAPAFQGTTVGGPIQLTDQNGQPFSDQSLRGKPFLVFFGFTHCPDVCPTALFEVSEIMRRLGPDAARAAALFISVDPERDTPAVLKEYLSSFNPNLQALTGDPAAIAAVAKAYRVYYKKVPLEGEDYTLDHTALVYLMDKQGRFVAPFNIKRPPEAAVADLRKYL